VLYVGKKIIDACKQCGVCGEIVGCSSRCVGYENECIGCAACSIACPHEAVQMRQREKRKENRIKVDGEEFSVPERITVKKALELIGYSSSRFPGEGDLFVPCEVGGCWSCAVEIDQKIKPSCVTGVKDGAEIKTGLPESYTPKRLVRGRMGHSVGGVGTSWSLKDTHGYVEAAAFACGCNLRCPQCQNWTTNYCGKEVALTPKEAAAEMATARREYRVDRMAISGGESTLNRPWLIQYIKELRKLNPDSRARFHVDTNASILTKDYIDELVEAGMTDVGPDLKGLRVETFMRITGLRDKDLAEKYLRTTWEAAEYLIDNHKDEIFVGLGIPFNKDLISIKEISLMGEKISRIDPEVQVCVLDYRPEFRRRNISRPSYEEMVNVWKTLNDTGLRTVVCQTEYGHIGPQSIKI